MRRVARQTKSSFREGYDARLAGKSPNDCPYSSAVVDIVDIVTQVQRQEWQLGYATADKQLAREGKKDA